MKFDVLDRIGDVKFTAEIDCAEEAPTNIKLGLAVKWAIKNRVDLSCTDLQYADLRRAGLQYADLRSAALNHADLRYASLRYADLRYATLSDANLHDTNLRHADLSHTDMRVLQTGGWTCYIQGKHIRIGCQYHSVEAWEKFTDDEISEMELDALAWWKAWKPIILAVQATIPEIYPKGDDG
jgi:hypothetical protein